MLDPTLHLAQIEPTVVQMQEMRRRDVHHNWPLWHAQFDSPFARPWLLSLADDPDPDAGARYAEMIGKLAIQGSGDVRRAAFAVPRRIDAAREPRALIRGLEPLDDGTPEPQQTRRW